MVLYYILLSDKQNNISTKWECLTKKKQIWQRTRIPQFHYEIALVSVYNKFHIHHHDEVFKKKAY